MANKVMIVGTGNVGMSYAYSLVNQRTAVNELVLVDINSADAEGEAMDLVDALAVAPGFMSIRSGDYGDAGDCDLAVITAGAPQKPGESRLDLLKKNAAILQEMVGKIMATGFSGIFIVVSNPVDVMAYLAWRYSGLTAERVIGSGTVLDSARLRQRLAERLSVNPKSVHAYQVGEHGDSEFTLWSTANIGGQDMVGLLEERELDEIESFVRNKAYEIIEKKGATYYGIGACLTQITNCILGDERRVLTVSSYDELSDTYNGFPAILGRNGIIRRVGVKLSPEEQKELDGSIAIIRDAIKSVL